MALIVITILLTSTLSIAAGEGVTVWILPKLVNITNGKDTARNFALESCMANKIARTGEKDKIKFVISDVEFQKTNISLNPEVNTSEDVEKFLEDYRIFYNVNGARWDEIKPIKGAKGKLAGITKHKCKKVCVGNSYYITIRPSGTELIFGEPLDKMGLFPRLKPLPLASSSVSSSPFSPAPSESSSSAPPEPSSTVPPESSSSDSNATISQEDYDGVTLFIGLENTHWKFSSSETLLRNRFGRLAAWENLKLFLTKICCDLSKKVRCVGNTTASGSLFLASIFGKHHLTLKNLDTTRPKKVLYIDEKPKPANVNGDIPWVYVNSEEMITNVQYWALFGELRIHTLMVIDLIFKGVNVSSIPSDFLKQTKVMRGDEKLPLVYKSLELLLETNISTFEFGSRSLGEGGNNGLVHLGKSRETGEEVAIKTQKIMSGNDEKAKLAQQSESAQLENEILLYTHDRARSTLAFPFFYASGEKSFEYFKYNYVNDLYYRPVGEDAGDAFPEFNQIPTFNTTAIAMERLGIDLETLTTDSKGISLPYQQFMLEMFDDVWEQHVKCNFVNRDIKLPNFMYHFKTQRIKLVDHGYALRYPCSSNEPWKGSLLYASSNHLKRKQYKFGDDMESLAFAYYIFVTKKQPISLQLEMDLIEDDVFNNPKILIQPREESIFGSDNIYVQELIKPFYETIRAFNAAQMDVEENAKDPALFVRPDYNALRQILAKNLSKNIEITPNWSSSDVFKSKRETVIQPEKDLLRIRIGTYQHTLMDEASEMFKANVSVELLQNCYGVFIEYDVVCNLMNESDTYIQFTDKLRQPLTFPPGTEEILATICSNVPCTLITNTSIEDAHLIQSVPMIGHYFKRVIWMKQVQEIKTFSDILDGVRKNERAILIQNDHNPIIERSKFDQSVTPILYKSMRNHAAEIIGTFVHALS